MTFISLIPISAPLDVRIISLAISEFITAMASICCRFAALDPDVHAAYKKIVNDFLIKAMQERMGGLNYSKVNIPT